MQSSLLYQSENILAESPLWHTGRQSFFWVDIDGKCFQEYAWPQGTVNKWNSNYRVSLIAETYDTDIVLLGVQGGLASFNLTTGKLSWLRDIEKDIPENRTNDGACDAAGRLWIGTMHSRFEERKGSLYCIGHDLSITKKIADLSIPNGIAWSQDEHRMYFIDSPTRTVKSFLFDPATGELQFEKIAITVPEKDGSPDGMCMDEEGMLWIAHWGRFGVCRWNPLTGQMLGKIDVPAPQVSSCAFGGPDMDQLLITTARENMSEEEIKKYPQSGNIFIAQPGVKGIPVHKFGEINRRNNK